MDIKSLHLFLTLSESLHFGRCSAQCHVSPSTLSRAIQQLESKLGTTLFLRDNRSVELTPDGKRFQQYARQTLDQWDAIRLSLQNTQGPLEGELSVYCSVTASYSFMHQLLRQFRRQQPHVEIILHTGDPEKGISRVLAGQEDIAMAAKPIRLPDGIAFQSAGVTPLKFIAPLSMNITDSCDSCLSEKNIAAWRHLPMILPERGVARNLIDTWFETLGISPHVYAHVTGNEAIVSMVSLGFGLGVVPEIVLRNSALAQMVREYTPNPQPKPYEVGLFTLTKRLQHPILKAFWRQAQLNTSIVENS